MGHAQLPLEGSERRHRGTWGVVGILGYLTFTWLILHKVSLARGESLTWRILRLRTRALSFSREVPGSWLGRGKPGFRPGVGGTRNSALDPRAQEDPGSASYRKRAQRRAQNPRPRTSIRGQYHAYRDLTGESGLMQGTKVPGLPFYWGLPGTHRPWIPRGYTQTFIIQSTNQKPER